VLRRRWGKDSVKNQPQDWVIPAKDNDDSTVDPFEAKNAARKDTIKKQKKRELMNKVKAQKEENSNLPTTIGISHATKRTKGELQNALKMARKSTISLGKFDKKLDGEKPIRNIQKRDPLISSDEKAKSQKMLSRMFGNADGKMKVQRAVNQLIREKGDERNEQKVAKIKSKKRVVSKGPAKSIKKKRTKSCQN